MVYNSCRAGGADSQGTGVGAGEEAGKGGSRAAGEGEAGGGGGQGGAGSAGCRPDEEPGTTGTCTHTSIIATLPSANIYSV